MPKEQSSASRKILVILALLLFIVALSALILNNVIKIQKPKVLRTYEDGYVEGYTNARNTAFRIESQLDTPVVVLHGKVTKADGQSVTFTILNALMVDERVDGVSLTRTVTVEPDTKIFSVGPPEGQTLDSLIQKDMENNAAYNPDTDPTQPPSYASLFEKKSLNVGDIKVGDEIFVKGSQNQDLSKLNNFTVSDINVGLNFIDVGGVGQ